MRHHVVWDYVEQARQAQGKVVKVKWVHNARAGGVVRARLVAMQIAWDLRGDCFAGTPLLVLVKYILGRAASLGQDLVVGIWDVSCAFLHAKMDEVLYLRLPESLCPPGYRGRCVCALYRSRRAGLLWGEEVA